MALYGFNGIGRTGGMEATLLSQPGTEQEPVRPDHQDDRLAEYRLYAFVHFSQSPVNCCPSRSRNTGLTGRFSITT